MAQIGAGTRILLGDATNPNSAANGGSDANLDDLTDNFTAFNFNTPMQTVDVTTLSASDNAWFRSFIAGLRNASVSGNYIESDASCAIYRRLAAIQAGSNHPAGRGKVDFRLLIGGAETGNLQVDGTIIVTEGAGLDIAIETALGHAFSGQGDGAFVDSAQA